MKLINRGKSNTEPKFSLKTILQHWAVLTDQTQMALTSLLTLLKENHPVPDYSSLPWTGKALLSKDCFRPTKAVVSSSIDDSDDDTSNHSVSENSSGDETEAVSSGTEEEEDSLLESDNAEKSSSEEDSEKSIGEDIPASQTNTNKKKRKKTSISFACSTNFRRLWDICSFWIRERFIGKIARTKL